MTTTTPTATYCLDNGWEHARQRLRLIEAVYDPTSIRRLEALGVGPSWRCFEVGAGGGSITRWLCSRVGPAGWVHAVDLDTRFVDEIDADNLDVERLDVRTAQLPTGAYDLVHTRAVLVHLPEREAVLDALVASLRPGGWLLVEEPDDYSITALASGLHGEVVSRMNAAAAAAGVNWTWARHLPGGLARRRLRPVGAESEFPMLEGSSPGAELMRITALQLREATLAAGATPEQLDEWDALLAAPGDWFPGWACVAAWGQRP